MDLATALFNCLPMPGSQTAVRRDYALDWLSRTLEGYREERADPPSLLGDLPLFLYVNELFAYSYRYKHWEPGELEDRADYLASIRERIENRTPVVEFRPGDLELLTERNRSHGKKRSRDQHSDENPRGCPSLGSPGISR